MVITNGGRGPVGGEIDQRRARRRKRAGPIRDHDGRGSVGAEPGQLCRRAIDDEQHRPTAIAPGIPGRMGQPLDPVPLHRRTGASDNRNLHVVR